MGSRNFSLGSRDIRAASRMALEIEILSFSSVDTMADRFSRFVAFLEVYFPSIRRMEHITREVVLAYGDWLVQEVEEGGLAIATAHNYLSAVNRVLEIARRDRKLIVAPRKDAGLPPRSGIAFECSAVSQEEHHKWLELVPERLALMMSLQRAFGLRFEEAAKFDARCVPEWLIRNMVVLVDGTKGGRKREVPIVTKEQRDILHAALVFQGPARSLIPAEMEYSAFRGECYRIAGARGIHFHRERHTYACSRYLEFVGAHCPVMAGVQHGKAHILYLAALLHISENEARELDQNARLIIALELGHGRAEITNAYLG